MKQKLLSLLTLLLIGISGAWATDVTVGRSYAFATSGTKPTSYTYTSVTNATVSESNGSGIAKAGATGTQTINVGATSYSSTPKEVCYRNNNGSAVSSKTENFYLGFELEITDGYQLDVSSIDVSLGANGNMSYQMEIVSSTGTPLWSSSSYTMTNYNKATVTNGSQSLTPTSSLILTGTVYARFYFWSASSSKYMVLTNFSISGDLSAAVATPHTVTFSAGDNGTCATTNLTEASAGAGVTLPAVTPNSGYAFNGWYTSTGVYAGVASETYNPSTDITLTAAYLGDATFSPVSASSIEGQSELSVTSTGATAIKYAWTTTEEAPDAGDYESADATEGVATITAPNPASITTYYLYVKGAADNGNDGNVVHASYTVSHKQMAAGLAYAKTSLKKATNAALFTNTLTNPNSLTVTYAITNNGTGSTINATTGEVTVGSNVGIETITASSSATTDFLAGEATYTITISAQTAVSDKTWNFSDDVWAEITGEENSFRDSYFLDNLEQIANNSEDVFLRTQNSAQSFSDGFSSTGYLYYGAVSANRRQIHIKVAGQSMISVYARGGDKRKIKVNKNLINGSNPDDLIGEEHEVPEDAAIYTFPYTGSESTDAYIYNSGSNGMYIYGIKVGQLVPSITAQPVGASYEKDETATALSVTAEAMNGGDLSYQWYRNTTNSTAGATELTGETSATFTPSTEAIGTNYYYCVVSEAGITATATSDIVAVSVVSAVDYDAPMATLRPIDCTNDDVEISSFVDKGFTLTSSSAINKSNWGVNFLNTLKVSGTVTITAASNVMIQAIKIFGMSNDKSGNTSDVNATSGGTGSGTLQARNDEGNLSEVTIKANTPAAGNAVSFTVSKQSRIYVVVYGNAVITAGKEYTTLTSLYDLNFTDVDGLKPYVVTADISDDKVTLSQRNKIAAGTGMVLKAETTGKTYNVPVFTGAGDDVTGNKMVGSATATTHVAENAGYILKSGVFQPSAGGDLPAGKAYLNIAVSGDAHALTISFEDEGETTGVVSVGKPQTAGSCEVYNLNGQRVNASHKGIVIVNGKKYLNK